MKIAELRSMVGDYDKDKLVHLIVMMYKAMPKALKEGHCIDQMIANPVETASKAVPLAKAPPDIDMLADDVEQLCRDARQQLYYAPNRVISKKERSNWRFSVKKLYADLLECATRKESLPMVERSLSTLYDLLCYACGYHTFATAAVFQAIKVPQRDYLRTILSIRRQFMRVEEFAASLVDIIVDNDTDFETTKTKLAESAIPFLDTPPLRDAAFVCCEKKVAVLGAAQRRSSPADSYTYASKIKATGELGFEICAAGKEFDRGVEFFKNSLRQQNENQEVALYVLLNAILRHRHANLIVRECERAMAQGIKPRDALLVLLDAARNNELPEFMPSNSVRYTPPEEG